jgi:2-dehydro-3-deoxyphosphogalactonate aldolase
MPADSALNQLPLVAILRGLLPANALDVGNAIVAAGLRCIEVPLNSPDPLVSIEILAKALGNTCLIGAGTVLKPEDVTAVRNAGGQLIVSPNCNPQVIEATVRFGMVSMPGIATPSEAFAAVAAGTRILKLFPASTYGPRHLKAMKDVLPKDVAVYAVGGVGADDIATWRQAGTAGFGFGSELFKPSYSLEEINTRSRRIKGAYDAATEQTA